MLGIRPLDQEPKTPGHFIRASSFFDGWRLWYPSKSDHPCITTTTTIAITTATTATHQKFVCAWLVPCLGLPPFYIYRQLLICTLQHTQKPLAILVTYGMLPLQGQFLILLEKVCPSSA